MNSIEILGSTEHKIIHSDAIIALNNEIADDVLSKAITDMDYEVVKIETV